MLLCFQNRGGSLLFFWQGREAQSNFFQNFSCIYSYCFCNTHRKYWTLLFFPILWFCVVSRTGKLVVPANMYIWGEASCWLQQMSFYVFCLQLLLSSLMAAGSSFVSVCPIFRHPDSKKNILINLSVKLSAILPLMKQSTPKFFFLL